jgi:hypothetical protein
MLVQIHLLMSQTFSNLKDLSQRLVNFCFNLIQLGATYKIIFLKHNVHQTNNLEEEIRQEFIRPVMTYGGKKRKKKNILF